MIISNELREDIAVTITDKLLLRRPDGIKDIFVSYIGEATEIEVPYRVESNLQNIGAFTCFVMM